MAITVKTLSKTYRMNVDLAETGETIKRNLPKEVTQLLDTSHCLVFGTRPLHLHRSLEASGVAEDAILYIIQHKHSYDTIDVDTVCGDARLIVSVPVDITVKEFKKLCIRKFKLQHRKTKVIYQRQEQDDFTRVSDFYTDFQGINEPVIIEQTTRERKPGDIQMMVKTLTGQVVSIFVNPDMQFGEVKVVLAEYIDYPAYSMRLIFAGRGLSDEYKVKDFGIVENSLVHLVLRLR